MWKLIFLIFISATLQAQTTPEVSEEKLNAAVDVLEKLLDEKGLIHTTTKELTVFHWENNPPTDEFELKEHVNNKAEEFYKPGSGGNAGPGFYAAIDPYSTKDFGNVLIELQLDAGINYLEAAPFSVTNREAADATTREILKQASCEPPYLSWNSIFVYGHKNCRKIIYKLFKKRDIQFITYHYDVDSYFFRQINCRETRVALAINSLKSLKSLRAIVGTHLRKGASHLYTKSNKMKLKFLSDYGYLLSRYYLWPQEYVDSIKIDPQAYEQWRNSLFNCH